MSNTAKRYLFFWLSFLIGYIFPFVYFLCKLGITKQSTSVVVPVLFLGIVGVIKLCLAIPGWVATWKPSVAKGIIKSIPIYLITILLITLGLVLKVILTKQIEIGFQNYFEFVIVFFGALCIASIFSALHEKYRELDLIDKGYVLGTVNKK